MLPFVHASNVYLDEGNSVTGFDYFSTDGSRPTGNIDRALAEIERNLIYEAGGHDPLPLSSAAGQVLDMLDANNKNNLDVLTARHFWRFQDIAQALTNIDDPIRALSQLEAVNSKLASLME